MKKIYSILLAFLITASTVAQVSKTINVTTAGTLSGLLTSTEKTTVTNLTVTGNIDTRDVKCMRGEMTKLAVLDISSVSIKAYSGLGGTSAFTSTYPANEMPEQSFYDYYTSTGKVTLKMIILPVNINSIGSEAFHYCRGSESLGYSGLSSISIPNSVTKIGSYAFDHCTGMTYAIIGSSVTSIGIYAFNNCSALTAIITNPTTPPNLSSATNVFGYVDKNACTLFVPVGSESAYKVAIQWQDFSNIVNGLPIVTTALANSTTINTASSGGNVTSQGTATVTSRGVCWSTSINPTIADSKTSDGTGLGIFTSTLAGLTTGVTYHIRAYATNSLGTGYGQDIAFVVSVAPSIITTSATAISATSATFGGNVTSMGSSAVTARGVCWSTTANPTTANSITTDGTGIGTFSSSITGLSNGTTYHVRAYATNSVGTVYGSDISFTTLTNSTQVYLNNIAFISLAQDGTQSNVPGSMTMNSNNPNNFINPGNRLRFKMQCVNNKANGSNIVSGSCKVRCNDPYITLTDSTSGLNNVGWNASAWSTDEFEIQINNNAPLGHVSYVDFIVMEGSNSYYTYSVPIPIAPLSIQTKTVDDDNNPDSRGNSNGICEPNEIIESLPTIQNVSTLSANNVSGTFGNYYGTASINVWNNIQGSSGIVANKSYWNYAFGSPQVITAGAKDMVPQYDFVFDYNYTNSYHFTMGLSMSGTFNLFSGYKSYIKWLIPIEYNVGYPDFNTGIPENLMENLNVYPNPTKGELTVNVGSDMMTQYHIQLSNPIGQKVYTSKVQTENMKLDLSKFCSKGIYFLQLVNDNGAIVGERKIIFK